MILLSQSLCAQPNQKNRVVILTDIEADPDDTQSMVRLLLYSNQIDIKGLIATTSVWHKTRVDPESIKKVIQAYGEVQPNLKKHEPGFPSAEALLILVKQGLPKYGMQGVGDGKDSEGSDWIIKVLEEKDGLGGEFLFEANSVWNISKLGTKRIQYPAQSDVPVLVLNGKYDPVIPPKYDKFLSKDLKNCYIFRFDGVTHSVFDNATECALPMVLEFLNDPGKAPDSSCMKNYRQELKVSSEGINII